LLKSLRKSLRSKMEGRGRQGKARKNKARDPQYTPYFFDTMIGFAFVVGVLITGI